MEQDKNLVIDNDYTDNIYSDDISYVLRWGISWIFIIGIILFAMTFVISWPEIIQTKGILTTDENPKAMHTQVQAKIDKLFVKNGQKVEKGRTLLLLDNTANWEEVSSLRSLIRRIDETCNVNDEKIIDLPILYPQFSNLGEIQSSYEQFIHTYNELKFSQTKTQNKSKIDILNNRYRNLKQMDNNLRLQYTTAKEDYQISLRNYEREKELFRNGAIPEYELREYESIMLNKRLAMNNITNATIQNKLKGQDIDEQYIQTVQNFNNTKSNFIQAYKNLKFSLKNWESNYQMSSPIDGIVSIPEDVQTNVVVSPANPTLYILPLKANPIFKMKLSQYNFKAIDTNKKVRIKFEAYPYQDFGVIEGKIKSIAKIPVEGKYDVTVSLSNDLQTSFKRKLEFVNGMEGEAEIILKNDKLIMAFFKK